MLNIDNKDQEELFKIFASKNSSEQGNIIFEIFDIFAKTKYFPKTTKTLKNLFVFDQQKLSM